MFKGNTTVTLNEATMLEALQEWFDQRVTDDRKNIVKSVKQASTNGYQSARTFEIELEEKPLAG